MIREMDKTEYIRRVKSCSGHNFTREMLYQGCMHGLRVLLDTGVCIHGVIILNRNNNSVFLYLQIY